MKASYQECRWRYISKRGLSGSKGYFQRPAIEGTRWGLTWIFHGAEGALHTPGLSIQTAALSICCLLANKRPATHILITQMFPAQILVDIGFFNLFWKGRHGSMTIALLFLFHKHCGRSQRVSKFPSLFLRVTSKQKSEASLGLSMDQTSVISNWVSLQSAEIQPAHHVPIKSFPLLPPSLHKILHYLACTS